jgi:hypothetical protein
MLAAVIAGAALALQVGISAPPPNEPSAQQVQFRGSPEGACPRGYDFNYSNGRCYPNAYHAPGVYVRPNPYDSEQGYGYRSRRYGSCRPGFDFNYSDGQCYPNDAHAPGQYVR